VLTSAMQLTSISQCRPIVLIIQTQKEATRLHRLVRSKDLSPYMFSGHQRLEHRRTVANGFTAGQVRSLITSVVAIQGLDISMLGPATRDSRWLVNKCSAILSQHSSLSSNRIVFNSDWDAVSTSQPVGTRARTHL
jgi:hypothetical protein